MLLTAGDARRLCWRRRREEIKKKEKLDLENEMRERIRKSIGKGSTQVWGIGLVDVGG